MVFTTNLPPFTSATARANFFRIAMCVMQAATSMQVRCECRRTRLRHPMSQSCSRVFPSWHGQASAHSSHGQMSPHRTSSMKPGADSPCATLCRKHFSFSCVWRELYHTYARLARVPCQYLVLMASSYIHDIKLCDNPTHQFRDAVSNKPEQPKYAKYQPKLP